MIRPISRGLALSVMFVVAVNVTASAVILPFDSLGPVDPLVNGISEDFANSQRYFFVTAEEGFYAWNQAEADWDAYTQPEWIGVARTAVVPVEGLPLRRVLGGVNAFFKGTLWLSDDAGENQTLTYECQGGRVTDIARSHGWQQHLIWATTWSDVAPGELLRSVDDGETWTPVTNHGLFNLTGVDVIADTETYVCGDSRVLRTFDNGATWEDLSGTLPAGQGLYFLATMEPVVALPAPAKDAPWINASHLFTSNDLGLYVTAANVIDWQLILPFPCRAVTERFVQLDTFVFWTETWAVTWDNRLLLWINGDSDEWIDGTDMLNGAEPLDVTASHWGVNVLTREHGVMRSGGWDGLTDGPLPPSSLGLVAAPNPFNPRTTLSFDLPQAADISLEAFDLRGRRVSRLATGFHAAGTHEVTWTGTGLSGHALPSGVYLVRLVTPHGVKTLRTALVR